MKNTKFKRILSLFLCTVLITAMALTLGSCGKNETTGTSDTALSDETVGAVNIGEGKHEFHFYVRSDENHSKLYIVRTDKTTVGEALLELGLIDGDDGEFGLYVKEVDGITADYETDGTYWAFYVNGEYAVTGAEKTDIVDGADYMFAREK